MFRIYNYIFPFLYLCLACDLVYLAEVADLVVLSDVSSCSTGNKNDYYQTITVYISMDLPRFRFRGA